VAERSKVLVVEDDERIRSLFEDTLATLGYQVTTASTGGQAIALIQGQLFDTVLCDIRMPEMDGLEILREIKRHDPSVEVVMVTGYPAVNTAVEALKLGAYDYLAKPVRLDELQHVMARLTERRLLRREVSSLRSRLGEQLPLKELIGTSPQMERVRELIARMATTDSPVLIEGESGTGKDLVAAAIHRLSVRGKGPFIPVNCGAVPPELLESEFFGHVRGAFSGAVADHLGLFRSANGGTLFLDEVAELPPPLQVKLLRVLEEKEIRPVGSAKSHPVDVRIVAARTSSTGSTSSGSSCRPSASARATFRPWWPTFSASSTSGSGARCTASPPTRRLRCSPTISPGTSASWRTCWSAPTPWAFASRSRSPTCRRCPPAGLSRWRCRPSCRAWPRPSAT
jgi:DNA-binding NtrC family response regulator